MDESTATKKFLDNDDNPEADTLVMNVNNIGGPLLRPNEVQKFAVVNVFNPETCSFEKQCFIKEPKETKPKKK